uniref:Extracellular globin n=1 Tax=Arenicola marina TaxID=6344 RepID=Q53I64_AREMA|nr:haemoglobin B2 chain [Arenicola marina]CAI56309.1 haemoglobin B2 chain [Arenicola marina]
MLRFVALLALVGLAVCDDCCTTEDRKEVQTLWSEIWSAQFTGRRVQVAQAVFEDLFRRDPESKNLFKRVNVDDMNSPEFHAHCIRVVNGLDTVIGLLDDPDTLKSQLEHLAQQHKERDGIHKTHFDEMSHAFGAVMPQVSSCFNPDAWNRCFGSIATKIASLLED